MGRRNLLQSSTYPDITGNWWRARLSDDDIRWARMNLVVGADGTCELERQPDFQRRKEPPHRWHRIPDKWENRVLFEEGKAFPWVLVKLGEQYRIRELADSARFRNDPELAPYVAFRRLAYGNSAVALGFLKEFGPLFRTDMTRDPEMWVDLNEFWAKQIRLASIVRLYESINDPDALRLATLNLIQHADAINSAGPAKLGMMPHTHEGVEFIQVAHLCRPDDTMLIENPEYPGMSFSSLRHHAMELIGAELTLHTNGGLASSWIAEEDADGHPRFRPERAILSLWAGMWELFGLDTWTGLGWRACRICGKYFYPLQRNSDCCTPTHQALWSKRVYAQRKRYEQKTRKLQQEQAEVEEEE
jgi:hypothetical protein